MLDTSMMMLLILTGPLTQGVIIIAKYQSILLRSSGA